MWDLVLRLPIIWFFISSNCVVSVGLNSTGPSSTVPPQPSCQREGKPSARNMVRIESISRFRIKEDENRPARAPGIPRGPEIASILVQGR